MAEIAMYETECDRQKLIRDYAMVFMVFHLFIIPLNSLGISTRFLP